MQHFVSSKQNKNTLVNFFFKSYWKYVLNACNSLFKIAHLQQLYTWKLAVCILFAPLIQIPEYFIVRHFTNIKRLKAGLRNLHRVRKAPSLSKYCVSLIPLCSSIHYPAYCMSAAVHIKVDFFFRVRCPEMQQKQSSLERQALLLFYGPILLSNVINEHINSTHYINSACVRVNVWGCVWLLVAAIQWSKAFACLWPSLCSFFPVSISLFPHRVVLHRVFFHENDSMNVPMSGS